MSSTPKKKRNRCVIKSCRRRNEMQNDKESGITFFTVPRSSLEEWRSFVPCLGKTSILCSRHFDEADIIKGQIIGPDNKFYPYLRWKLKKGASPKHWLEKSKETEPQVKKSKYTEVKDQPKVSKAVKSLPVNLQDQQQVKKVTKSKDQSIVRTVLQSLSANKQTPSQKKDLQSLQIQNQEDIPQKTGEAQVDHDYALPLHEKPKTADELQDPLFQSVSHSNISVIQGDNINDDSSISHQICCTAEDQVDHYCAMPVEAEEQPQHPVNPISHPVLLSSAPDVNFTEPVENQVSATSDVIAPTYVVDDVALRCFSSYVKLPSQFSWAWSLNKKDNILSCSNCSLSRHGSFIIKTVRIISESSVSFLLNGNTIAPKDLVLNFSTYQELSALIHSFSEKRYCEGILQSSLKDVQVSDRVSGVQDVSGRWRSKHCIYLVDSIYKTVETCSKCKQLKKYLKQRSTNVSKKKEDKEKARQTLRMYRRRIHTLEKLDKEKSVEIETWRRDFRKLYAKWKRKLQKESNSKRKASRKKLEGAAV